MATGFTPLEDIPRINAELNKTFVSRLTQPVAWRQHQLLQVARMVKENHGRFASALYDDLGRPATEAYQTEIGGIIERALIFATKLPEWMVPDDKTHEVPEWQKGWKVRVFREAKGVMLVVAPWNYPMILTLQPLLGAIAAGNCCVVKPSEIAPVYAQLLQELLPKYLDERAFRVIYGAIPETTKVLECKWDHIFYTGNAAVGRIVAQAAAKHLTPITLELGGKSPVLIDPKYPDFRIAAKRILWGKTSNAGQICVCPDYIILPTPDILPAFLAAFREVYSEFFPSDTPPLNSSSYSSIISDAHFKRVSSMIQDSKGKIILGGGMDATRKRVEPTVILFDGDNSQGVGLGGDWENDSVMSGEIFGPILPIVVLKGGMEEAVHFVRSRPHPLVLYTFSDDDEVKDYVRKTTMSGNLVFNETFMQLAINELPFGGVGESGYGRHILHYSFLEFTYPRSSIDIPMSSEPDLAPRYPPYTEEKFKFFFDGALQPVLPDSSPEDGIIV